MKREAEVREALVSNTMRLIAEGGFEKATTRAIAYGGDAPEGIKLNESYIYRLFGSKEGLYESVFIGLDEELYNSFLTACGSLGDIELITKEVLYAFFLRVWRFILGNEEKCRCYVRYYYSIYFKATSLKGHNIRFERIVSVFKPLFREEADVIAIMHSVFTTLLGFAIRVYNGDLDDNDINVPHIFNVLYCMMMTYFKKTIQ